MKAGFFAALRMTVLVALLAACSHKEAEAPAPQAAPPPPAKPAVVNEIPGADPLIPFDDLLLHASYEHPKISPDGKHIAVLGQVNGVGNLMLADVDKPTELKPLTHDTGRGLQSNTIWDEPTYRWSPSGKYLFYIRDDKGDENWVLYVLDIGSGESRQLTPAQGVRVAGLRTSPKFPDEVMFGMNDKGPAEGTRYYRVSGATGEREFITGAKPYLLKLFDDNFDERVAVVGDKDLALHVLVKGKDGSFKEVNKIEREDQPALGANHIDDIGGSEITADGKKLISFTSQGLDTTALAAYDFATNKRTILAQDKQVDIKRAIVSPSTGLPQAYRRNFTIAEWVVLDDSVKKDFAKLAEMSKDYGEMDFESRTADDRKWIVSFMRPDYPIRFFLYDRDKASSTLLGVSTPQLATMKLSGMQPVVMKSSDGFDLVSYVSYPSWTKVDEKGIPTSPLPVITVVHGGPGDERAIYAFAPLAQWITNRGYALFLVNFRGTPGFGKKFINAEKHEWGGAMNRDVIEQVHNLVDKKIADPKRLAIFGGSYGGYETLAAMTLTPGEFACGNAVVGPSNLETFIVGYGKDSPEGHPEQWYPRLGDPRTPEGLKLLKERSPFNYADKTKGAMLITQGANDVRVPTHESEQVVDAMNKAGVKVTYLLYPDEGHGLIRPENNKSFLAISEVFFGECLGGRYSALSAAQLEGSSVRVPTGADRIPGLTTALAARKNDGMLAVDASIDPATFGEFAGSYDLKGYKLTVALEGKQLFIDIPGQGKHEMLPTGKDKFFLREGPVKIAFKRDDKGAISEMAIEAGETNVAKRL
ncbi:MAG TPA: prolyl oligopeptidase family serine peptidase [Burkholderiales bacterium]|nr:prolyl oligopeptidase family serine peptidase [Burkholderiales bacterium]